jgi:hypothetical protein
MHTINVPTMIDTVLQVAISEGEPVMFHGEPGCGKTEGIVGAAKEAGAELIDIRLGQYDSVDLRGFPGVDAETGTTVWHMPSTLPFVGNPRFDPDKKKLIFLDEINAGNPSVLGVAYQLLQEGRVGEHILQPNTYAVAAGNRMKDRGVTNRMPTPLNNRLTHYEVAPDADAWVLWAATQPRIPAELMAFLQFRKPLISTFDPSSPEPAFATPRTWVKAARYFTSTIMAEGVKDASIEGCVGEGPSAEFRGFCKVIKDMPSMASIEANPTGVAVSEKPEVRWAVAVGIAGEMSPTNTAAYQQYLDRMDPEFGILAWQLGLRRNEALIGTKEFISMARTHQAIFASVGR